MSRVLVAAHRGVAAGAAENTIEAFTNAIAVGADMIEFDVRMTRDGKLIAFHDARVNGVAVGSLTRDDIESAVGVGRRCSPTCSAPAPAASSWTSSSRRAVTCPTSWPRSRRKPIRASSS
jgi:glycerophosphoryl diester phosphodiesterase